MIRELIKLICKKLQLNNRLSERKRRKKFKKCSSNNRIIINRVWKFRNLIIIRKINVK
jgi:hypothetical protein